MGVEHVGGFVFGCGEAEPLFQAEGDVVAEVDQFGHVVEYRVELRDQSGAGVVAGGGERPEAGAQLFQCLLVLGEPDVVERGAPFGGVG